MTGNQGREEENDMQQKVLGRTRLKPLGHKGGPKVRNLGSAYRWPSQPSLTSQSDVGDLG